MVRKEFWLDPASLAEAKEILGLDTERETVQTALDMVAMRGELVSGVRALKGLNLERID
jgi:Arc/MetJ family transcription regulator